MADADFEHRLLQLFAETPPARDAVLFARRVEQRLEHQWLLRRGVIGLAAAGSALLAAWQLAGSAVAARVMDVGRAPLLLLERRSHLLTAEAAVVRALPAPGEIGWLLAGLLLLAVGLAATRMVDEV